MSIDAMKLALKTLEAKDTWGSSIREAKEQAITALRQAIEQAQKQDHIPDAKKMVAQPEQDTCKGCNGNGVVGNILDTDTCPFCKGSGVEAQPKQKKERCVGCEACIDTACGRDECPKGWPKAAQPEQEPLEYWNAVEGWVKIDEVREHFESVSCGTIYKHEGEGRVPLYTTPPQRKPLTDEMRKQMKDNCDSMEMRGAFTDGWLSAEAAHGITGEQK